jgi:hypothetical protein
MYKFVNPMKYLEKKERVGVILAEILTWPSFFFLILSSSLVIRAISMTIFLIGIIYIFLKCMKVQALITQRELMPFSSYERNTPPEGDYDEEEDDYDDEEEYEDYEDDYEEENSEEDN